MCNQQVDHAGEISSLEPVVPVDNFNNCVSFLAD